MDELVDGVADAHERTAVSGIEDESLLSVLCTTSELDEDGETLTVGDPVSRPAVPHRGGHYGTGLDATPWMFDRYAEGFGVPGVAQIDGVVTSIHAIRTTLTQRPDGVWTPLPGSARLEQLRSTADTRRPEPEIRWEPHSTPDASGTAYARGSAIRREGDEDLSGWLVTVRVSVVSLVE